jgi:hypothetical protein
MLKKKNIMARSNILSQPEASIVLITRVFVNDIEARFLINVAMIT